MLERDSRKHRRIATRKHDRPAPAILQWRWGPIPAAIGGLVVGAILDLCFFESRWDGNAIPPGVLIGGAAGLYLGLLVRTWRAALIGLVGGILCGWAFAGMTELHVVAIRTRNVLNQELGWSDSDYRHAHTHLALLFMSVGMLPALFDTDWRNAAQAVVRAAIGGCIVYAFMEIGLVGVLGDAFLFCWLLQSLYFLVLLVGSPMLKRKRSWGKRSLRAMLPFAAAVTIGGAVLAIGIMALSGPIDGRGDAEPKPPPALVPSTSLAATDILPHTEGAITPGRNYVYCGTFALAWREMRDKIVGSAIDLEGASPMANRLNTHRFSRSDLAEDSYLAQAGTVAAGIVEQFREEMARKFPQATMSVPECADPSAVCAFAYLWKNLAFEERFDTHVAPLSFPWHGASVRVATFGIKEFKWSTERDSALMNQLTILDYASADDFVLRLTTPSANAELVLAKVAPARTLEDTVRSVQERIRLKARGYARKHIEMDETLAIPKLTLNVSRTYSELEGRRLRNRGWEGYYVARALQAIRFRLDEEGAKLESFSNDTITCLAMQPRRFIFDKPFLIYMKERTAKRPYFAMWIENAEVMVRRR